MILLADENAMTTQSFKLHEARSTYTIPGMENISFERKNSMMLTTDNNSNSNLQVITVLPIVSSYLECLEWNNASTPQPQRRDRTGLLDRAKVEALFRSTS